MWKDYSASYIKKNRASSISVIVAALISAFLLSFLCSLFYNFWEHEVDGIVLEEGDWHVRITGDLTSDDLIKIQNFGNVEKAVLNKEISQKTGTQVVDINLNNARTVYEDVPLLIRHAGLQKHTVTYHELLLSRYFITDPQDENPPLLTTAYLVILIMVSLSLILIIRNSFAMSMNARIHQFGIFSSVGATPGQIRTCLMQEAVMLCSVPILFGSLTGIAASAGMNKAMNMLAVTIPGGYASPWAYHPLIFVITIISTVLTVLVSAWLPARKLSKMTPLQAVSNTGQLEIKKKKSSHILSWIFGIEGELAGNALKVQKKAMRTSTLSLTLSFLGFTMILCLFTLSDISTRYTYFEKYQDAWDIMAVLKDTQIEDFAETEQLRKLSGIEDLLVYQKAEAISNIAQADISEELTALGGPEAVAGTDVSKEAGFWTVKAPIVILDDEGFLNYCEKNGISPRLDGTVVFNRIWDSVNTNFRYREFIPFLSGKQEIMTLKSAQQTEKQVQLPVLGFTQKPPVLREEYEDYTLVQFLPASLWDKISEQLGGAGADMCIRVLAEERTSLSRMDVLVQEIKNLTEYNYKVEIENRIQEKITNDEIIFGYKLVLGGLCAILALIGIANIFSNTLGFIRQRKREFAQYMSVGMTPQNMRKMFCIEAIVIAGRPLLITFPATAVATGFMLKLSYLEPVEFIAEAPVIPVIIFSMIIVFFVSCAYYIGGKRVLRCNLADALRDDTIA